MDLEFLKILGQHVNQTGFRLRFARERVIPEDSQYMAELASLSAELEQWERAMRDYVLAWSADEIGEAQAIRQGYMDHYGVGEDYED